MEMYKWDLEHEKEKDKKRRENIEESKEAEKREERESTYVWVFNLIKPNWFKDA